MASGRVQSRPKGKGREGSGAQRSRRNPPAPPHHLSGTASSRNKAAAAPPPPAPASAASDSGGHRAAAAKPPLLIRSTRASRGHRKVQECAGDGTPGGAGRRSVECRTSAVGTAAGALRSGDRPRTGSQRSSSSTHSSQLEDNRSGPARRSSHAEGRSAGAYRALRMCPHEFAAGVGMHACVTPPSRKRPGDPGEHLRCPEPRGHACVQRERVFRLHARPAGSGLMIESRGCVGLRTCRGVVTLSAAGSEGAAVLCCADTPYQLPVPEASFAAGVL